MAALCAVALVLFVPFDSTRTLRVLDIDPYPVRSDVTRCADPMVARPGVDDFRDMILSQVGGGDDGLAGCKKIANGSGLYSDHADGRAWDWHVEARRPRDRAMVDRVLDWLLRTDERGHRNAMARRIGITYIIWNHGYYRVGGDDATWVPYTSTGDPHDTHVHFSFSVAGANRGTSWWTERGSLRLAMPGGGTARLGFGGSMPRPLAGDWDGDGRDAVGIYTTADRRFSVPDGPPLVAVEGTPPLGPFGAIPVAGDWDGTGGDEVGVYEPLARRFTFYTIDGGQALPAHEFGAPGDQPIVGDWDGDGRDDIGTYTPATRTFSMRLPDGSVRSHVFGAAGDTPVVGDWNGDGTDDIGVFRSANHTFVLAADRDAAMRSLNQAAVRQLPVVGDWDGDGRDDVGVVTAD